jgi:hypothetical protein
MIKGLGILGIDRNTKIYTLLHEQDAPILAFSYGKSNKKMNIPGTRPRDDLTQSVPTWSDRGWGYRTR